MVVIAPFSPTGTDPVQSFNLGGVGNGGRAVADARTQRACLGQAIEALPPAEGGNLLQAQEAPLDHPSFNLVPKMPDPVTGVYFVAPDEGIDPLRAEGVRTFVDENLCESLTAALCSSGIEPELDR